MNDLHLRQKTPRKILGNGSRTEYSIPVNNLSGYFWSPNANQTSPLNNTNCQNINNLILTDPANSITNNNLLQQQQMERLRNSNIMNQEMHALWPYGTATFLSPMLPTHNMPLPYALAGTLPYAAVPIYQSLPNANTQPCTVSPASSSSSGTSSAVTTSNQQQTQIQYHFLRSNSIANNSCANESNSSLRNSPILLSSEDSSLIFVNGGGGDATNSLSPGSRNGTATLSQSKFNELTRLALRGSEIAEKLAYTHRNRPCFKKIDSLCARMKQDLIRPDGVLPNINSQGIAWAVKDFIFVFTRVINAWIIIKGYVFNTPEGLNKVKSALSPDFQTSFAAWQDTTIDFIENLVKSFVNLDNLVQSQKNVYQKSDNTTTTTATAANRNSNTTTTTTPIKILQHGNPLLEESFDFLDTSTEKCTQNSLDKNYIYTMVEDSEASQRQATINGTYFKTGTYTPIKKDTLLPGDTCSTTSPNHLFGSTANTALEQYIHERLNEFWTPAVDIDLSTNVDNVMPAASTDLIKFKENITLNWMNYDLRVLEQHLSEFSTDYDPNGPSRPLGKDLIEKLNIMIERLNTMKTADFFFKIQFTENYFPEFVAKHKDDFIDIRSIIFKCQIGGYQHIYEVVHDVRKIIYAGKEFLKLCIKSYILVWAWNSQIAEMHHHHPHNTTAGSTNSNTTQLPTQRRRKKRPNYGTRTVEVRRGYSGFGFTISGQQPCRLSCIIPNSPADQAGLRAGDCLISVNGLNVSKLPHETVVQLIGNSFGSIRMQIAEHYYSDSTDDENTASCSPAIPSLGPYRPRYVYHKTKQQRMRNSPMKKNESQLPLPRTAQLSKKCPVSTVKKPSVAQLNLKRPLSEELKCTVISPSLTSTSSTVSNVRAMVRAPLISAALEYKAIVGYLGTIEMPKQISHSSKLQTVRSCIRKLRQEKRAPSTVLMVILPDCLKLLSNTGNTLATYASSRLNYVSSSSESENRFFGLVTSTIYTSPPEEIDDDGEPIGAASHSSAIDHITISNSCHVFVVDTKLCDHSQHVSKAQEFRIECTKDPISNLCLEFPNNSEYVVNLIRSMYTMRIIPPATQRSMSDDPNLHAGGSRNTTAHSPQPSNHSEISTTTSNSDSGIGYNNDCSNITDRIVVVDFPQPTASTRTSHITLNVGQRPHNICQQDMQEDIASSSLAADKRLTVRAMPDPKIPYNLNSPTRCLITSRSCDDVLNLLEQEFENFDDQPALTSLSQQCYASMDDISLYPQLPTKEDHQFIRPLKKMENFRDTQVLSAEDNGKVESADTKNESKTNLRLKFETWNSVHDISCQSIEITQSSPDKLISTPDLSKIDLEGSNSPFERGWIQTSLRTPRADKHTLQFSLTPEATKVRSENAAVSTVCRSDFLINSDVDRNSVDYRISTNDLTKHLPKGPSAWSSSIEVLLADPAGIKSFAEFLKQEYAAENIFFWTACERFRNIENASERQEQALIIYTKHLTSGSLEPVNVDSKARSMVEQNLSKADKDLFQPAQKQIFNLMKFDCYQRFLKSELYKQCLQAEKKGKPLPFNGENLDELLKTTNFSESASSKLKKSASNAEEGRRRRSLLPWHRKANHARSKSRDRIAIEKTSNDNTCTKAPNPSAKSLLKASDNIWKQSSSIHGSKSSLASFDALPISELNCNYCRIKFPDGATTITQLKPDETVAQLVERLFEKRNVKYQFYDVSISGPPSKSVDLQSLAQELSQKEVEIEQRVAFKLDLPTPKVISVKSKPRKQLYEVVRPILQRYNINLEVVDVVMRETQEKVDLSQLVTHIDNKRLQVVLKKTYPPLPQTIQNRKVHNQPKSSIINGLHTAQSTLDEITNKVFSDLMNVKNQNALTKPSKLDQCSLKSDECASESSSYLKRIRNGKKNEEVTGISQIKLKKISLVAKGTTLDCKLAIKEKVKGGVKQQFPLKVTERKEDLLEDLKRAQLARLEDQRGTEINFELPEFLKNTENLNSSSSSNNNNNNGNNCNSLTPSPVEKPPQPAPRLSIINPTKSKSTSPAKLDEEPNFIEDFEDIDSSLRGPPPLPPKPKVLPIKPSNWGVNVSHITKTALLPSSSVSNSKPINANISAIPSNNVIISPNVRCAYLDQPSSSFV